MSFASLFSKENKGKLAVLVTDRLLLATGGEQYLGVHFFPFNTGTLSFRMTLPAATTIPFIGREQIPQSPVNIDPMAGCLHGVVPPWKPRYIKSANLAVFDGCSFLAWGCGLLIIPPACAIQSRVIYTSRWALRSSFAP